MREITKEFIDGHLSFSELIEKIFEQESDPFKKANIINEIWKELELINKHLLQEEEKKKKRSA